jgi:acetylxylan esterase
MPSKTLTAAFLILSSLASSVFAAEGQLQELTDFGPNPNGVGIYLYEPASVTDNPALIVAIHYCTGTADAYFTGTEYANYADQLGYLVLYPEARRDSKCFDVASNETLTHDAGGDSLGIASAVRYALENFSVDASRVFVTGTSSGGKEFLLTPGHLSENVPAMMTNVMSGSYPELFAAASAYSGVPFGCFAGPTEWNEECAQGQLIKTAEEWVSLDSLVQGNFILL